MSRRAPAWRPGPGRAKPWLGSDEPRWMRRARIGGAERPIAVAEIITIEVGRIKWRSWRSCSAAVDPILVNPSRSSITATSPLSRRILNRPRAVCGRLCKRYPLLFTIAEAVHEVRDHSYVGQRGSVAVYNRAACDEPRGRSGRRGRIIAVKSTARAIKMRIALLPTTLPSAGSTGVVALAISLFLLSLHICFLEPYARRLRATRTLRGPAGQNLVRDARLRTEGLPAVDEIPHLVVWHPERAPTNGDCR